jgi:hypothetical protein
VRIIWKQDPHPHQNKKKLDPDLHQSQKPDLDPQQIKIL